MQLQVIGLTVLSGVRSRFLRLDLHAFLSYGDVDYRIVSHIVSCKTLDIFIGFDKCQ